MNDCAKAKRSKASQRKLNAVLFQVVAHRRELQDDAMLQAVEEQIRKQHAARELDDVLPLGSDDAERPRL